MSRFFDERASSYDDHMRQSVASFERFYTLVSRPIRETRDSISVLDLGCGTGLELESVFKKAPNARITGIDLSANMLSELERKYAGFKGQITLVNASYKNVAFPEGSYDYAISVMSFHHYLHVRKRRLYEKIRRSLKGGGVYIEGDYVVSPESERQHLEAYHRTIAECKAGGNALYHIDIPFSVETQTRLLSEAGFAGVEVLWHEGEAAILVAVNL